MNLINVTAENLTRVNNDVNGNPRYVFHYTNALPQEIASSTFMSWSGMKYEIALMLASEFLGGRKFNNRQYGGGIVFQSYNTRYDLDSAEDAFEASELKYHAYSSITLWAQNTEKFYVKAKEIAEKFHDRKYSAQSAFLDMKYLAEEIIKDMKASGIKVKKNQKVLTLAAAYLTVTFEEIVNSL